MTSFMIFQNAEMGIIFLQKAVANLSIKSNIMTCFIFNLGSICICINFLLGVLHSFYKVLMRRSYEPIKRYFYL